MSSAKESILDIDPEIHQQIAAAIHSDQSPVGIDARKTHIIIIGMLQRIEKKIEALESRMSQLESNAQDNESR